MTYRVSARLLAVGAAILMFAVLVLCMTLPPPAKAQTAGQDPPIEGPLQHTVTEGENLTTIADLYGVSVSDLQFVNHLNSDDILSIGRQLLVPGGDQTPAIAIHRTQIGESIKRVAGDLGASVDDVLRTNRSINRDYVPPVGQRIAVEVENPGIQPASLTGVPHIVQEGETLLDLAVLYNAPVSHLRYMNDLPYPAKIYPGQRLRMPGEKPYIDLPGEWAAVEIDPEPIRQGDTVTIYVENLQDGEPSGRFSDQELVFSEYEDGFVTLVGLDAFTPTGAHTLQLGGAGERPWYPFEQDVSVEAANFPSQVIVVDEELNELLEPSVRAEEDAFLSTIFSVYSEDKKWSGLFQVPVTDTVVTAPYGGGRSYNEGPVTIFHSGTDFGGNIGTPILAAADGVVVFNDELDLRGNTVIIDHGWGVMTGYYHLSESYVEDGEDVEAGQSIGAGGSTGLSTGPHLHWDLRIRDIAVDGMQWIEKIFPPR